MINMPQGQPISSPLYGPQAPRDGLVQALMTQAQQPAQAGGGSGIAGLSPEALKSLAKYFNTPNDPTQNLGFNTPNAQTLIGGTPNAPGFD